MKKLLLTCVMVMAIITAFSQAVQRDMVVMEIGTGVTCGFCPGAAMGAEDLLTAGCHVAVIEYHNYNAASDPFSNSAAATRCNYYGISGYPTAFFDGIVSHVGGSSSSSLYSTYLPLYNQRYAVPAPLVLDISGTSSGNNYSITLTITKLADITSTNLKAHLVLTESHIPYSWLGQTEVNDVERLMVPDAQGTTISFASGNTVTLNLSFTKDPSWVLNNCQLIAFVQDNSTKECLNGTKKMLNNLALPLPTDFSANPTSGCSPMTVNYTDLSVGATVWSWTFPGGNPATSTLKNPTVVYNSAGTFDASLNASNPGTNQAGFMSKTAYISVNAIPVAPYTPLGTSGMCINPENQTYVVNPVSNTNGYTWDLSPAAAGVLTPNGTSCVVNYNDTWTGEALLKVQGYNSCGGGAWSVPLPITISETPGIATVPTGPIDLCKNSPNTEYTTTGGTPVTSYQWELFPAGAGALYPNWTSVFIDWVDNYTGACQLRVKPINGSCEGQWTNYLNITIESGPATYEMTGGGVYCAQSGTGSAVGLNGSQPNVNYTLFLNGISTFNTLPGTGSALNFGNQLTTGDYTVQASSSLGCLNTMNGTAVVSVDSQSPETPAIPEGPEHVYSGGTPESEYITTGSNFATSYSWELNPPTAGTISGNTTSGTATWNPLYTGNASVKVSGVNTCGTSSYSSEYVVTVDVGVGISEPGRANLISIFPNPASDHITIIPAHKINATIIIYNTLGETLISKPDLNLENNYQLDIRTLKSGIYFVQITNSDKQQILKLIVE